MGDDDTEKQKKGNKDASVRNDSKSVLGGYQPRKNDSDIIEMGYQPSEAPAKTANPPSEGSGVSSKKKGKPDSTGRKED